jgi:hypothetical protein
MKFNNLESLLIVILCITSVVDTIFNVLTYIRG